VGCAARSIFLSGKAYTMPKKKKPKKNKVVQSANARDGRKNGSKNALQRSVDRKKMKRKSVTVYDGDLAGDEDGFVHTTGDILDV